MNPDLDTVLRGALAWPVANVAFIVIDPHGDVHAAGAVDQPFALASLTKLFTSLAVLIACEEQVCSLDDTVEASGIDHDVTVRDVLCHASGLPPVAGERVIAARTRRVYSNFGYDLLGGQVERRAGFAFAEYVREAVVEPLGMRTARLVGGAGAGMIASAADVALLLRELASPTLIAPDTWREMTHPVYPDLVGILPGYGRQSPNSWGLGPEIRGTKSPHWSSRANSPDTFGHFGRSGTLAWIDPVANVSLVALSDREFGSWAVDAWPRLATEVLNHAR